MSEDIPWIWLLAILGSIVPLVWKQLAKMGVRPWFPIAGLVAGVVLESVTE